MTITMTPNVALVTTDKDAVTAITLHGLTGLHHSLKLNLNPKPQTWITMNGLADFPNALFAPASNLGSKAGSSTASTETLPIYIGDKCGVTPVVSTDDANVPLRLATSVNTGVFNVAGEPKVTTSVIKDRLDSADLFVSSSSTQSAWQVGTRNPRPTQHATRNPRCNSSRNPHCSYSTHTLSAHAPSKPTRSTYNLKIRNQHGQSNPTRFTNKLKILNNISSRIKNLDHAPQPQQHPELLFSNLTGRVDQGRGDRRL